MAAKRGLDLKNPEKAFHISSRQVLIRVADADGTAPGANILRLRPERGRNLMLLLIK